MATIEITITEDAAVTPDVLVRWHALETDLKRVMKQRDALVVERDAILQERDESIRDYKIVKAARDDAYSTLTIVAEQRDSAITRATTAEASLLKASAEVGRLQRLLDDECKFNGKLDREIVGLHSDLEQSEAKRLQLLAALDEKDELLSDFSKENARLDAELASTKQQLTELKLKHNQPAAFPWTTPLFGYPYFVFNTKPAVNITASKAEAL